MSQTMADRTSRAQAGAGSPMEDLLMSLASRGVYVRARRGGLRVDTPADDAETQRLVAALSAREGEALEYIRRNPGTAGLQIEPLAGSASFKLTDLQGAYQVGELDFLDLHTRAYIAQGYEVSDLDVERLAEALRAVMSRHEMLRVVVIGAEEQEVHDLGSWSPTVVDWTDVAGDEGRARFAQMCEGAGDLLAPLDVGPQLACTAYRTRDTNFVLIVVRLFVLDARSIGLVWADIAEAYAAGSGTQLWDGAHNGLFRRYLEALARHRQSQGYRNSVAYWERRLPSLPPAPALPADVAGSGPRKAVMRRAQHRLPAQVWKLLQARCRNVELSANAVLCSAYMDVLGRWSGTNDFSVTVLVSTRALTLGSGALERCVGNFGTTMVLAPDRNFNTFLQRARELQLQMANDLQHCFVSAVEVLRRGRHANPETRDNNPYVFASGLDTSSSSKALPNQVEAPGWRCAFKAVQTPQVLLDHQVFEDHGDLVSNFDYVADAFPQGMIEELVAYHAHLLERLASDRSCWESETSPDLPEQLTAARRRANSTAKTLSQTDVLEGFFGHAKRAPGDAAMVTSERALSYQEVQTRMEGLHRELARWRGDPPRVVGVLAEKGAEQYVGALAVMQYGGAYVPLNIDWPPQRLQHFIAEGALECVLADERGQQILSDLNSPVTVIAIGTEGRGVETLQIVTRQAADLDSLAYVIYTSGSTGVPKGVAISRRGVLNTVVDVCERFSLSAEDRILSLSELNFDLSAFDLVGALHCGGAVVIPPYRRHPDPESWAACLRSARVTVWNSVPALMEMLLDYVGTRAPAVLSGLRLVMLSGDWIPLDLPSRLHAANPSLEVVALGGATEASIWSNYHVVDHVDASWKSIPYGRPLANQQLHVLDAEMAEVPTWVAGDLYIGGDGLATEYVHQPALTSESFLVHPRTGDRVYRTGDRGRYLSDGSIEFLGRTDSQVKVRGHRLDLVEIEKHLEAVVGVGTAVCVVNGDGARQTLVALVIPSGDVSPDFGLARDMLCEKLPRYAIPDTFRVIDAVPLTANGKRDTVAMRNLAQQAPLASPAMGGVPATPVERSLTLIWEDVCETEVRSVNDDFFSVGGSSLLAVQLVRRIEETFGTRIALSSLFEQNTIEAQARLIEGSSAYEEPPVMVPIRRSQGPTVVLIHPIGGHVLCYRSLIDALPRALAVYGLQSPSAPSLPQTLLGLASLHAEALLALESPEPVHLVGWSMGGVLGIELAHVLERLAMPPASLTLIDAFVCAAPGEIELTAAQKVAGFFADYLQNAAALQSSQVHSLAEAVAWLRIAGRLRENETTETLEPLYSQYAQLGSLLISHRVSSLPNCPTELIAAAEQPADGFAALTPLHTHQPAISESTPIMWLPGDHYTIISPAHAAAIAARILELIASDSVEPARRSAPAGSVSGARP